MAGLRPVPLLRDRPKPCTRLSDDQPAQELTLGDYLTFKPAREQPLRVCLLPSAGSAVYLPVTPTAEAPTYLECRTTALEPLR